jgi:hypothetical protein
MLLFSSSMFSATLTRVAPAGSNRQLGALGVFFHFLSETRIYVPVILGIATVLGAYFASGVLRVALIVLAVLLGALVVWDILVAAYLTILAWGLKTWIDRQRARKAHRQDRA